MAAPRFFVSLPLTPAHVGAEVDLPDDTAHYAVRVRRLAVGDALTLFTGDGGEFAGMLVHAGKRDARVRIDAFTDGVPEPARDVTLVQAITATDTMDIIVRHAVELGARALQPVVSARSARFPDGAHGDKRLQHWRAVTVAGCEQCGRNRVPRVDAPLSFARRTNQNSETVC